jgi:hypothetical protein
MSAKDRLRYPGLFASTADVVKEQQLTRLAAGEEVDGATFIADQRELRYRAVARSAFLWVFIGVPLVTFGAVIALAVFASMLGLALR